MFGLKESSFVQVLKQNIFSLFFLFYFEIRSNIFSFEKRILLLLVNVSILKTIGFKACNDKTITQRI